MSKPGALPSTTARAANSNKAHTNSMLLQKLPAELRNKVYRYVLVPTGGESPLRSTDSKRRALLQTCRQIRQEAIGIYYAETTFMMTVSTSGFDRGLRWLQSIGPHAARHVQRIFITFESCIKRYCDLGIDAETEVGRSWTSTEKPHLAELRLEYCSAGETLAKALILAGLRRSAIVVRCHIRNSHSGYMEWSSDRLKAAFVEAAREHLRSPDHSVT